jgi:acyl-CoA thioester hydrolase
MNNKRICKTNIRVRFEETDALGVVWHGNYARYFEVGRFEWIRMISSTDIIPTTFLQFVAKIFHIEYHYPAKFDDWLVVTTELKKASKLNLVFSQNIYRDKTLIASAEFFAVSIDKEKKIQFVPKELREILRLFVSD